LGMKNPRNRAMGLMTINPLTRWQNFYLEDTRIASVGASYFSKKAAHLFSDSNKRRILDLACGVGRDSFYMAGQSLHVTGTDLARSGLEIARQDQAKPASKPVDFLQADAHRLPFKNEVFEGVYCFGLLHEFSQVNGWQDICEVMAEIYRVLSPGGILLLAILAGDPQQGLPHVLLFTEDMVIRAAQAFSILEKERRDDLGCTGRADYSTWQMVLEKR
jgi:ubiquinone/menaquinone biosynthesis C-methylase UbiE